MPDVRLMTLDPGHFHAALIQKESYPGVAPRADVFAPLGSDLIEHLKRIAAFNARAHHPTAWDLEIHTDADPLERMLRERPGNVVVLSGRNRGKIDRIAASVRAGLHVLADKPWILSSAEFPVLEAALADADTNGVVAYDVMTERFEITSILQRALVNDPSTFGAIAQGTPDDPAVYMESVHYILKTVAGAPNIRPAWFFDITQQGEGLNDVGAHLVDLVQWTLCPGQAINYRTDVRVLAAQRWPTRIPEADFRRVTATAGFPDTLARSVREGELEHFCNTLVSYTLRGIHTTLNVSWDWEPPAGSGDTHFARYRGTRSHVEIRQTRADRYRPELYVVPVERQVKSEVLSGVRAKIASMQRDYRDLGVEDRGSEIHVTIPDRYRAGHEAHFGEVTLRFLQYLQDRSKLPAWERPNMLAKYHVTTKGTELGHAAAPAPAPRLAPG